MVREHEHQDARRAWTAERNKAERNFNQFKILIEMHKQKEGSERHMAQMRDIILTQSGDIECLRRELNSRDVQSQPSDFPFSGLRPRPLLFHHLHPRSPPEFQDSCQVIQLSCAVTSQVLLGDDEYELTSPHEAPDIGGNNPGNNGTSNRAQAAVLLIPQLRHMCRHHIKKIPCSSCLPLKTCQSEGLEACNATTSVIFAPDSEGVGMCILLPTILRKAGVYSTFPKLRYWKP